MAVHFRECRFKFHPKRFGLDFFSSENCSTLLRPIVVDSQTALKHIYNQKEARKTDTESVELRNINNALCALWSWLGLIV